MTYFEVILIVFVIYFSFSDAGVTNSSALQSHSIKSSDVNLWRHTSFKVYTRLKKDCFPVFIPNQNWATCFFNSLQMHTPRLPFTLTDFSFVRSCYTNVNYRAWHVYKPLFSSSVASNRLACSEIFLSINKNKAGVTPGKWSDIVQTGKPL